MEEEDNKIKMELKEENPEYEDCKESCYPLIGIVKEEKYGLQFKNSIKNDNLSNSSIQTAVTEEQDPPVFDDKTTNDTKEYKVQNDQKPSDYDVEALKSDNTVPPDYNEKRILKVLLRRLNENVYSFKKEPTLTEENPSESEVWCSDIADKVTKEPGSTSVSKQRTKYIKPRKFICPYCGKGFPQSDILKYHIMVHTGQRPLECSFCFMRFKRPTSLKVHLQLHTVKKHSCKVCNKKFVSNYNLKLHMLAHENKREYKCNLCSRAFNTRSALYNHITQKKNSKTENDVKLKTYDQSSVKKFQCDHCKKMFKFKNDLSMHIQNIHMNKTNGGCKVCGVKCSDVYCLKHMRKTGDSFTCSVCKLNFNVRNHFNHHIKHVHKTDKPHGCNSCNASFKERYNLMAHIEVHHRTCNTKYVCDICKMSFNRQTYLKRHYEIHTQSDRKYACDLCNIKCRSITDMRRHMTTHFDGLRQKKPYHCQHCDKSFTKPSKLARHEVVHTGEKRFKCSMCEKAYKDEGSLQLHHQNIHEGKTFTCNSCGFCSINEHSFKRHLRKMICQKKTYKCEVCEKVLTSEHYYKRHMKNIHSNVFKNKIR